MKAFHLSYHLVLSVAQENHEMLVRLLDLMMVLALTKNPFTWSDTNEFKILKEPSCATLARPTHLTQDFMDTPL